MFGGAGVDVLIGNTGGERLIDWNGEFNMYIGPFSPYGEPTVSRKLSPSLAQFLYDLSKSAGADQTLTTARRHARPATASRTASSGSSRSRIRSTATSRAARVIRSPAPRTASATSASRPGTQPIQAPGTTGQPSAATINVTVTDASGAEQGLDPIVFSVTRTRQPGHARHRSQSPGAGRRRAEHDYTVSVTGARCRRTG